MSRTAVKLRTLLDSFDYGFCFIPIFPQFSFDRCAFDAVIDKGISFSKSSTSLFISTSSSLISCLRSAIKMSRVAAGEVVFVAVEMVGDVIV